MKLGPSVFLHCFDNECLFFKAELLRLFRLLEFHRILCTDSKNFIDSEMATKFYLDATK